ncbi:hypothetical protein BDW22DRAFT_616955 [Trametopsis cervina]|nr:hypothetical protein BDW22DRAFT_616955 [Trametopsis cervina]
MGGLGYSFCRSRDTSTRCSEHRRSHKLVSCVRVKLARPYSYVMSSSLCREIPCHPCSAVVHRGIRGTLSRSYNILLTIIRRNNRSSALGHIFGHCLHVSRGCTAEPGVFIWIMLVCIAVRHIRLPINRKMHR